MRIVVGRDGVKVQSTIDFVLVKMLKYVMNFKSLKGGEGWVQDFCKIKLFRAWMDRKEKRGRKYGGNQKYEAK